LSIAGILASIVSGASAESPRHTNAAGVTTQPLAGHDFEPKAAAEQAALEIAVPRRTTSQFAPKPNLPVARSTVIAQQSADAPTPPVPERVAQAAPSKPSAPAVPAGLPEPQQVEVPPPPRFDIERFDVQGNTLLSSQAVLEAVTPYTGKNKDFADVQRALESLQNRYQRAGYGSVQVLLPEQELERGVIALRVVEPKLGKVTIEGNKFFDEANIRRSVPSLQEGKTPNAAEIGASARLANENPAKRTTVLLRAGSNESEIDATVRVQDEKFWRAALTLDNTGSPTTGMYRLGLGFQHSNMFNLDHTFTVQYQLDPEPVHKFDDLKVLGLAYRVPFYSHGGSLDLLAAYSSIGSSSGQVFQGQAFNISGSGTVLGARYNQQLPRIVWLDDYEHRVTIGFDYKAFSNQVVSQDLALGGFNQTPDTTVYPLSLTYSGTKRFQNAEFGFFGSVSRNIHPHGSDAFAERFTGPQPSALDPSAPGAVRGVGTPRYTVWRYGLNYVRAFVNDMQFRANITGQWTEDALIAGEQFGVGGWESVRGMLEREGANDRGYRGSLEVYSPDIGKIVAIEGTKMRLLAFLDWAGVRQNYTQFCDNVPASPTCGFNASSLGFGMRMSFKQGVSFRLDYAQMLDGGTRGDRGDRRFHGGMSILF